MILSYTQISNYLRCPRSYRYRYLDGWREKDTRAAMIFGRCFEKALAAQFQQGDCAATLFREWGAFRDAPLEYKKGESWDCLVHQGVHLLEQFARDNRVCIRATQKNLQIKMVRALPGGHEFVAYLDAIGDLDGHPVYVPLPLWPFAEDLRVVERLGDAGSLAGQSIAQRNQSGYPPGNANARPDR